MRLSLLFVLVAIAARAVAAQDIESILRDRVDFEQQGTSIVVAVVDKRGTRFFSYGRKSRLKNAPMASQNTVYEIGSVSKVFTGILLAEAVKRGEVKLHDPISKYLPQGVVTPKYNGKEITLLNLIWHTSGLPFKPDNLNSTNPENPWADYTAERLYEFLGRYQLPREPPTEFDYRKLEYSNLGVGLLGYILSLRANTSYENLVKTRILGLLGMNDTSITLSPRMKMNLATAYNADGDQTSNWHTPILEGAAALRSTVSDMAKFISANLGFASTNGVSLEEARRLTWNKGTIVGGKLIYAKNNLLYHGGSTGGYISFLVIDIAQKKGVFVVSNSQGSVEDIALHIIDNNFPVRPTRAQKREVALREDILESYVGEYQLPDVNLTFTITRQGRRLFLQQAGGARVGLYPSSETEFFFKTVEGTITFTRDQNSKVYGLILHQKGDHAGRKIN